MRFGVEHGVARCGVAVARLPGALAHRVELGI